MHQLQAMVMAEVVNMRRLQGLEQAEAVDYKASTEFVRKNLLMKMKNVSYLKKKFIHQMLLAGQSIPNPDYNLHLQIMYSLK